MQCIRVAPAVRTARVLLLALGLILVPATVATAATPSRAVASDTLLIAAAGWHSRAIQQPLQDRLVRASSTSPPPGWSAGPVALGTGLRRAGGSRRVREIQRRLKHLGYGVGPVDGRFGALTRAAVAWFQRKHGLPLNGRATLVTVSHLRERTGAARPRQSEPGSTTSADRAASSPSTATPTADPAAAASDGGTWSGWAIAALVFVVAHFLALGYFVGRRWRRTTAAPVGSSPAHRPAPATAATTGNRAVGYIRLARGASSASFHAQAAAIETGCLARGITLVSLVSDVEPDGNSPGQPAALAFALEGLDAGDVDRLVVSRLDHLSPTREGLDHLLRSIGDHDSRLVVLDRDRDTNSTPDLIASHGSRHPDRQVLSNRMDKQAIDPHIISMLDNGLSREAIVAALNAEPVPPPRGTRWSFSSLDEVIRRQRHGDSALLERSDV